MTDVVPHIMKLWPTNIMVQRIEREQAWHDELVAIAKDYAETKMVSHASGFKHAVPNNMLLQYKSEALTEYFDILQQHFWIYLEHAAGLRSSDITKPRCHMFGNVERRGQWSVPHAHMGNQIVMTYYPRVTKSPTEPHPFAGSMVFHNPRNPPSGFWGRKETLFTPINTVSGTLVAFPGHAEHSTFPFFDEGSEKIALVCNIRFTGILEGENSADQYQSFEDLNRHRRESRG